MNNKINRMGFANFKSFGPNMQTFSRKPITLVYGANSVGKSSVLHAFLYLKYITRLQGLDANRTTIFGDQIDFGKFENVVFCKKNNNTISYIIEINKSKSLKEIFTDSGFQEDFYRNISKLNIHINLTKEARKVDREYKVLIDGEELYSRTNSLFSIPEGFKKYKNEIELLSFFIDIRGIDGYQTQYVGPLRFYPNKKELKFSGMTFFLGRRLEKLSRFIRKIIYGKFADMPMLLLDIQMFSMRRMLKKTKYTEFIFDLDRFPFVLKPFVFIVRSLLYPFLGIIATAHEKTTQYLTYFETSILNQSTRPLYQLLVNPTSMGNKKEVRSMWVDLYLDEKKRELINSWLSDPKKLKSNYKLQVEGRELSFLDLRTNTKVYPKEMGLGISQVLPILYASLCIENEDIFIEQPELHLHPAAQSELADEFIKSINNNNNSFKIETHSEHLLLRLMRRMRQTAEETLEDESLKLTPDDVCLLYVDADEDSTYIQELRLSSKGTLLDHWPNGFFEEGFNERFS